MCSVFRGLIESGLNWAFNTDILNTENKMKNQIIALQLIFLIPVRGCWQCKWQITDETACRWWAEQLALWFSHYNLQLMFKAVEMRVESSNTARHHHPPSPCSRAQHGKKVGDQVVKVWHWNHPVCLWISRQQDRKHTKTLNKDCKKACQCPPFRSGRLQSQNPNPNPSNHESCSSLLSLVGTTDTRAVSSDTPSLWGTVKPVMWHQKQ